MMEEIAGILTDRGYSQLQSKITGLEVFYKIDEFPYRGIWILDLTGNRIIDETNFKNIEMGVRNVFAEKGIVNIELLCLIVTDDVNKRVSIDCKSIKEIALGTHGVWMLDTKEMDLVIYENQPLHFFEMDLAIQEFIEQERIRRNRTLIEKIKGTDIRYFVRKKPIINWMIIFINVLVFLILEILGSTEDGMFMAEHGAGFVPYIAEGEYYRLFTSIFMHFGFEHLMNNMVVLYFIGDIVERTAGKIKYIIIYLGSGLIGSTVSFICNYYSDNFCVSAGASGAIFGVIGALLFYVIINKGKLEDMTTRKLIVMIGLSLYHGFVSSGVDNVAHVSGLVSGAILSMVLNLACCFYHNIIK